MIYFVKCGEYVKIGKTVDITSRLAGLQTGNPYELEVLKVIEEGKYTESSLHELFKAYRVRGEWFTLNDEIKAFISSVKGIKHHKPIKHDIIEDKAALKDKNNRIKDIKHLSKIRKLKLNNGACYKNKSRKYYNRVSIDNLRTRAAALFLTLDQALNSLGFDKNRLSSQDMIYLDKLLYNIWVDKKRRN